MAIILPTSFSVQTSAHIDTRLVVDLLVDRDNIAEPIRYWGMTVHVIDSTGGNIAETYILNKFEVDDDITNNSNWVVLSTAGSSPLTTKGDIFTYSTGHARLPISGNDGWVLAEDSAEATGLKWVALVGGGDMLLGTVQTVTASKTFEDGTFLLENGAGTFTARIDNTNTANRVYDLQNADGTLAFLTDITGTNSGTRKSVV